VTKATAERYVGAGKKEKGRILDEFALLTKYNPVIYRICTPEY